MHTVQRVLWLEKKEKKKRAKILGIPHPHRRYHSKQPTHPIKIFVTAKKQINKYTTRVFTARLKTEKQLNLVYFPQAVASSNVVGFRQCREIENRRPEIVDRASLAHHHLSTAQKQKQKKSFSDTSCVVTVIHVIVFVFFYSSFWVDWSSFHVQLCSSSQTKLTIVLVRQTRPTTLRRNGRHTPYFNRCADTKAIIDASASYIHAGEK